MEQFRHHLTDRVLTLLQEANNLRPNHEVLFEVMHDPQLLHDSDGAAVRSNKTGQDIIYLDPNRANEHMVAHELMHVILHRSYWPQMYSIALEENALVTNIADSVDNIIDQYIFDPRLARVGIDLTSAREWYVARLEKWPNTEQTDPGLVLHDALKIVEALLFRSFYRRRVVRALKKHHPKSLTLAQQIEARIDPQGLKTKAAARQAMIDILNHIDTWLSAQIGHEASLKERIGISPLFTREQMQQLASEAVEINSYPATLGGKPAYIATFVQKSDHVRFYNVGVLDAEFEPPPIGEIRDQLQMRDLNEFLEIHNITTYGIDD